MSSGGAIMFGVKSFTFSFAALLMATGCNQKPSETADNGEATNISGNAMDRSEEHTSELQSLMRISYAVFCLKKKTTCIRRQQSKYNLTSLAIVTTTTITWQEKKTYYIIN